MVNSKNATYLTEKYLGRESSLWTPCIHRFLINYRPELPISACIDVPSSNGPWYELRKEAPSLKVVGDVLPAELGPEVFLQRIGDMYGRDLSNDLSRNSASGDITGIYPDIVLIQPNRTGVYVLENKPYYHSKFDGNQFAGGAYTSFVEWLNNMGIPTQYLVIQSASWREYAKVYELQGLLKDRFGVLLLEDVFSAMAQVGYKYDPITEDWSLFTNKSSDFA